jgi:hypothetical protein
MATRIAMPLPKKARACSCVRCGINLHTTHICEPTEKAFCRLVLAPNDEERPFGLPQTPVFPLRHMTLAMCVFLGESNKHIIQVSVKHIAPSVHMLCMIEVEGKRITGLPRHIV